MTRRAGRIVTSAAVLMMASGLHLIAPAAASAESIAYLTRITGISDDDLYEKVTRVSRLTAMQDQPPASLGALHRRVAKDLERFSKVLRSEGYYDHSLQYRLDTTKTPLRVRIRVEPGPPYQLALFDVILDSVELGPAMEAVGAASKEAEVGRQARAAEIVKAEDRVLRELGRAGYPFPELVKRDVVVDHAARSVTVRTTMKTGRRARFGTVEITGVRTALAEFARHRVPWEDGDQYDPEQLEVYRTHLATTGLFSVIRIKPKGVVLEDGSLPILVELERGKLRSVGAGVFYSSSEGPGASAYWEHRDLLGRAERLRLSGEVSGVGETGRITFRKPDFFSVTQTLVFDTSYGIEETEAYDARKFKTSLGIERVFGRHWTALAGIAFEIGPVDERAGDENVTLVGLPLELRRDTSNDILDPTTGSKLSLYLAPYIEQLGSDVSFVVTRVSDSLYFPIDEQRRFVLAGRAVIGSESGAGRFEIPADKRFYSGGGGSVRGFAYQMAGPLDQDEDPVGGRSLAEGSLELRWRFWESFGLVPFVDAGNVYDDVYPSFEDGLFWGAGLGLRYYTRLGPIRLDVATPLNPRDGIDDPVQFYISLGQAY